MSRHLFCPLLIVAFLTAVPIHAQWIATDISESGNRFLEVCSVIEKMDGNNHLNEADLDKAAFCSGFVLGVNDGTNVGIQMLKSFKALSDLKGSSEDVSICLAEGVTTGQEIRVLLKYIRQHPEQAHLPSAGLVLMAEYDAFPCPATPAPTPKPKQ
jgi:hypothetical protein